MSIIVIDFETYYDKDYGLKKLTTAEYIRDPRFEVVGVGMFIPELDAEFWLNANAFQAFLWEGGQDLLNQAVLVAHHAHFDGLVLSHHFGVRPAFWMDTMLMSRPFFQIEVGGSLKKTAEALGLEAKGEEVVAAIGKHAWDFTPEEYAAYGEYCKKDCRIAWGILQRVLAMPFGEFPKKEAALIDHTIRMFTEPVMELDVPQARKFKVDEEERKRDLLRSADVSRAQVMSNEKFAQMLQGLGVDPPTKPSPRVRDEDGNPVPIWAFAAKDVEFQMLQEHPDPRVQALMAARVGNKSTINVTRVERLLRLAHPSSTSPYSAPRSSDYPSAPLPVYLKYAGAHTFRWSGGDKLNWQNFERVDEAKGKGIIRKCIRAPKGRKLVVVDSAQIEARGAAWLAGQEDLVAAFAAGRDVYSEFASIAYGRPVDGKSKACAACGNAMKKGTCVACGGREAGGLLYPDDEGPRRVGKVCILGLGYSMGQSKLASQMLSGPMGMDPIRFTAQEVEDMQVDLDMWRQNKRFMAHVAGLVAPPDLDKEAHMAVCAHLVQRYRARNQMLTEFWWHVAPEILDAMMNGVEAPLGPLSTVRNGIVLPSGLVMRYPDLKYREEEVEDEEGNITVRGHWSYWSGRERTFIHGGLLFENIIQALSRQIVAEQMLTIAEQDPDFRPVTMAHDEIVMCPPEGKAEECLALALRVMREPPEWAAGWPLDAEGGIGDSYGEAK